MMTINQAIFVLNCVEAHNGLTEKAKEIALKSLNAWQGVKDDLAIYKMDCDMSAETSECISCNRAMFESINGIIDKHLGEVEG